MTRDEVRFWLVFTGLFLSLLFVVVRAQTTVILSDTSKPQWTASPDNGATFGTPPQPILTSYQGRLYLRSRVTFPPTGNPAEPTGAADITLDLGKPTPDAANLQTGPVLKPLVVVGTEYVMFIHAVGPGGTSSGVNSAPFGSPSAPRAAGSAVTFTP